MCAADGDEILIYSPHGDATDLQDALRPANMAIRQATTLQDVAAQAPDAGMVLMEPDAADLSSFAQLRAMLDAQPPWSNIPFVIVTDPAGDGATHDAVMAQAGGFGALTIMERPFQPSTLLANVRNALATRQRQYRAREHAAALAVAARKLEISEKRLAFALHAGRHGTWELLLPQRNLQASDAFRMIVGRNRDEPFTFADFSEAVLPGDLDRLHEAERHAIEDNDSYAVEMRIRAPAGDVRWIEMRGRPDYDEEGEPRLLAGIVADITERKRGEERQRLLVRELYHRVKNTLATVQALMSSTARSSPTIESFRQAFFGRITSLSRTHEIITDDKWQEASLRQLFLRELEPYGDEGIRIRLRGPDVKIPSHLAVPVGLAIHELATNAVKFGSLSVPEGHLDVQWSMGQSQNGPTLSIEWSEGGGPSVRPPSHRGFGSQLLDRVLRIQASASVAIDYLPEGLRAHIVLPLPERQHFHLFGEA